MDPLNPYARTAAQQTKNAATTPTKWNSECESAAKKSYSCMSDNGHRPDAGAICKGRLEI
jgi:hypothetical protein